MGGSAKRGPEYLTSEEYLTYYVLRMGGSAKRGPEYLTSEKYLTYYVLRMGGSAKRGGDAAKKAAGAAGPGSDSEDDGGECGEVWEENGEVWVEVKPRYRRRSVGTGGKQALGGRPIQEADVSTAPFKFSSSMMRKV